MIVVGIDPGFHTGLAVWDTSLRKFLDIRCLSIVAAMDYLDELSLQRGIGLVVFEDARQRKWIPRERDVAEMKGRAMGAGSVKRDCAIWEEWCEARGTNCVAVKPKPGLTKWTDEHFRQVTGYPRRTNEHGRDAALLVFGR